MNAIRLMWHHQWRLILIIATLVAIFVWLAVLVETRTDKLTDDVWSVELVGRCYLDYHANIQAVALACPGVDYVRLWPLPVVQPWWDPTDEPEPGWYARSRDPARRGGVAAKTGTFGGNN